MRVKGVKRGLMWVSSQRTISFKNTAVNSFSYPVKNLRKLGPASGEELTLTGKSFSRLETASGELLFAGFDSVIPPRSEDMCLFMSTLGVDKELSKHIVRSQFQAG